MKQGFYAWCRWAPDSYPGNLFCLPGTICQWPKVGGECTIAYAQGSNHFYREEGLSDCSLPIFYLVPTLCMCKKILVPPLPTGRNSGPPSRERTPPWVNPHLWEKFWSASSVTIKKFWSPPPLTHWKKTGRPLWLIKKILVTLYRNKLWSPLPWKNTPWVNPHLGGKFWSAPLCDTEKRRVQLVSTSANRPTSPMGRGGKRGSTSADLSPTEQGSRGQLASRSANLPTGSWGVNYCLPLLICQLYTPCGWQNQQY